MKQLVIDFRSGRVGQYVVKLCLGGIVGSVFRKEARCGCAVYRSKDNGDTLLVVHKRGRS